MEYHATGSTGSLSSSSTSTSSNSKPPLDPPSANSTTPDLLFPSTQIPTIALSIPTTTVPYSLSHSPTIVYIGSSSKPLPPKRALSLSSVSTPSQPFFSTLRTTIHQPNSPGLDERGFPGLSDRTTVEEDRGAVSRYGASGPRGRRLNGVYTPVSAETGTSAGALQPGARNDTANQLEAKVVIRQFDASSLVVDCTDWVSSCSGQSGSRQDVDSPSIHFGSFQLFSLVDDRSKLLDEEARRGGLQGSTTDLGHRRTRTIQEHGCESTFSAAEKVLTSTILHSSSLLSWCTSCYLGLRYHERRQLQRCQNLARRSVIPLISLRRG